VKLTPRQREARLLVNGPATHILLDGGSRSGKTALFVRNIIIRALRAPGSRHAIFRFRYSHVKDSIGMETLPWVMKSCFPGLPCEINKAEWYMRLPEGSEVWLGGLDDKDRTEKVLGREFVSIYLNECSQIPWNSRGIAMTRLAQSVSYSDGGKMPLKMYYDCNPATKGHWTYQLFHMKRDPETKQGLTDPEDYVTLRMNPQDNMANLPSEYIPQLEKLSGRLRKRFLLGEYGDAAPGALWSEDMFDRWRAQEREVPDLLRVVVAVDPSGADDDDDATNDQIGIVVVGLGVDNNGYVLEDLTLKAGPDRWGKVAAGAFDRHKADLVVGEKNFGGEMVRFVIQAAKPNCPVKLVTASRGKVVRAEPISALTEQGKIRFAGSFPELEEELCGMTTHGYVGDRSPNRADAFVWGMSELFPGLLSEDKPEMDLRNYMPSVSMIPYATR
jgi:Phage terminase large subunit/Terminase RNaseH-like domain